MNQDELNNVELPAIEQLQKLGWRYIHGAALTPDALNADGGSPRVYMRDVVLVEQLNAAIKRINPWISDENLKKVSRELTHPNFSGLMEYNHAIYQTLVSYQSVEQDLGKGRKGQTVKIIDFDNLDNNEFVCSNQFKVEGANQNIIPDIVCFVNGLPLAVIECKSPYITSPMAEGINQLRRYANLRHPHEAEGAEKLFWYNQIMVSTCRDQAKVGTISSSSQHYGDWKDAYPFTDKELDGEDTTAQQRLLAGMFSKSAFLDLLQNFVIFEKVEGKLIKKVARYQQFRAVNKVIERLKTGEHRKDKSGVVWHTQGSGKSLTMVMLAVKMRRDPILQQYKLVFITDRTQLDEQLSSTFRDAQGETVYNATSVAKLRELLKKDSSDLVTAMVQKFQDAEKEAATSLLNGDLDKAFTDLNPSDKIIVLADEAHRTQFGGLAMVINAALPNAPKIGFTGTPLLKTQKMGKAFGGYIDQYKINEAVDDGATVRILYEGREVITDVSSKSLDKLFEEYFADYSKEEQREIKKKYGVERAVREAPARIRWVCIDLLKHYREHIQPDGFKAMIVTGSRHAAALYKKTLDELGAPLSEVIISGGHNDEAYLAQFTDKAKHKKAIAGFTKPLSEDSTSFLIVKDMLLTGFDAPIAQVMYIDRKLQDHTLMQAIARVNRTYKGKTCGFVVDYYGLSKHLTDALELFTSDDVDGTYQSLKDEIPKLKAAHTVAMSFFKDVLNNGKPSDDVDDYVLALKNEDIRAQFEIAFKRFAKQMNVILPDKGASPFIRDLTFLGKVLNAARVRYREEGLDLSGVGEKVRKLVDEHIISTGVDPKIPPIDLLAANFKEMLKEVKSTESKASEVESAIKHHITVNLEEDPEYYKSLSLRLRDIIVKNAGHWERQLELLLVMVDNIEVEHQKAAQDVGLSDTEYAFYNILMAEVTSAQGTDVVDSEVFDEIKKTTQVLVSAFDEATEIVDFFNKQDEVKRMKKTIKRAIIETSFGEPSLVKIVQERFMELGKTKFNKR
ncbi:HsdR family type I site-specific deoxyribonuclease [Parashewanella spongiae]|uniref:Type I restriction enzyme endonuclease subunit n=1 Tax=Parashewanella spongiae TaxID=342950 RepID=A0A3A6U534_9GAMM|nr:HsdR family type I site-specific deoxyribonuclease [Parashewanella spongiae]MCL1078621.1 HsdR family type I site-specific deoxyribonuclease [Parashewanella spongiae]RJY13024.1 HsdR family type I site-specific deoxyribonuclease [Parashewanella spongiae]